MPRLIVLRYLIVSDISVKDLKITNDDTFYINSVSNKPKFKFGNANRNDECSLYTRLFVIGHLFCDRTRSRENRMLLLNFGLRWML